jgi:hypothetical protein
MATRLPGYAFGMNEVEAKEACTRLAAEHPERHTHRWVPTKRGDEWMVAKIGLPPPGNTTAELRADERPPTPDDVRGESPLSNLPAGWYGA